MKLVDYDALRFCRSLEDTGSPGAIHMAGVIRRKVIGKAILQATLGFGMALAIGLVIYLVRS